MQIYSFHDPRAIRGKSETFVLFMDIKDTLHFGVVHFDSEFTVVNFASRRNTFLLDLD